MTGPPWHLCVSNIEELVRGLLTVTIKAAKLEGMEMKDQIRDLPSSFNLIKL